MKTYPPAKLTLTQRIAEIYRDGGNIMSFLRSLEGGTSNSLEDIMISYDFQAGSYIRAYEANPNYLERYTHEIASLFRSLGNFVTVLEAGCGEATTLALLSKKLSPDLCMGGFDIAWSRVKVGASFSDHVGAKSTLFCSDLFHIPLQDRSIDVVYTSHSVEPNGGREHEAISELARVARKWLVLLEPAYDLASDEARKRMETDGYVKNLAQVIRDLGLNLVRHELFPVCGNTLNPTGLYLVKMDDMEETMDSFHYQCPLSGCALEPGPNGYFSPNSMLVYPVVGCIPYLIRSHAILATKFA